jgi:hypothetical protein
MFLKNFKTFSAKRVLKKSSLVVNSSISKQPIQTVGVLVDESVFNIKEALIQLLVSKSIKLENISVLAYKNSYKKKENISYPHFSKKDISWFGTIENKEAKEFISKPFDLLISYYDEKKVPLQIVTHKSMANFKVGFAASDKRLNHFMIDSEIEKHTVFVDELFKYLRILNKL